jgi:hypothetical protein
MVESDVQKLVKLEASKKGFPLWRNNVGAVHTNDGRFIRFGLGNESKRMNACAKSSDLIGIRPLIIRPEHVGITIGQFVAREVKKSDWVYSGTERERAQLTFLEIVTEYGGDAAFCTGEGTL